MVHSKRGIALATLCVSTVLPTTAQLFAQHETLGGINDEHVGQVVTTSDGGYLIVGSTGSFGPSASDQALNAYVIKFNREGDTVWTRIFGGDGSDGLNSVTVTGDGGYVVAGGYDANAPDILLARFSSDGTPAWVKRVGTTTHQESAGKVIALDNDEYLVVGSRVETGGGVDGNMLAVKVSGAGTVIWATEFGSAFRSDAKDVARLADGGFMIAGTRWQFPNTHFQLARLDSNGTYLWDKTYQSTGSVSGVAIAPTYNSNFFVAGSNADALAVWKVDANGDIMWERDYSCGDSFAARDVESTDSEILVTGSASDIAGTSVHHLLRLTGFYGDLISQNAYGASLGFSEAASVSQGTTTYGILSVGTLTPDAGTQGAEIHIIQTFNLQSPCDDWTPIAVEVPPPALTSTQVMTALAPPSLQVTDLSTQMAHGGNSTTLCTNVGVEDTPHFVHELQVIPNPASDHVDIRFPAGKGISGSVRLIDVHGRELLREPVTSDRTTLSVEGLAPGVYSVLFARGTSFGQQRFVVQH
ncbi:MAG: T9SS type A sorting domain-containing protein [Flavobacteriales bacterium]